MHSLITAYNLNERLLDGVRRSDCAEVVKCLMRGAKATLVSGTCGRTAIGLAAIVGNMEILELLIQSCEEPDLYSSQQTEDAINVVEKELDSTPDGMDNLEWEDEFTDTSGTRTEILQKNVAIDEEAALYYYYAKTFERTGGIFGSLNDLDAENRQATATAKQDIHALDGMLMTPLHYAAACCKKDCANILMEHGANVNAVNGNGYTPLHMAVYSAEVTQALLNHGANPNVKTLNNGMTVLHLALRKKCKIVANIILQNHMTDINAVDHTDQTALMCAIIKKLYGIASDLIINGARINLHDKEGRTALYYAVYQNNVPLATLLIKHGARRVTSHHLLHCCVRNNWRQMAELMIANGEPLNVRDQQGFTPINLAICAPQIDMLEYLVRTIHQRRLQELHSTSSSTLTPTFTIGRTSYKSELMIAVQFVKSIKDFRPIVRILFAFNYGASSWITLPAQLETVTSLTLISSCHNMPYCKTPLAYSIVLHKYDMAEFLIKEGIDIGLTCSDHILNSLRQIPLPGNTEIARLLGMYFQTKRSPHHIMTIKQY